MGNKSKDIVDGYEHIQGEKLDSRSEEGTVKDDKFRSYQKIRDKLCQLIKKNIVIPENGIVVDLGTGSNAKIPFDIRADIEAKGGIVVGLDITDNGVKSALNKKKEAGYSSFKIVRSNSVILPIKNSCADVVTANLSMHHIFPDPIYDKSNKEVVKNSFENILHEVYRILQYDGLFLVSESVDPTSDSHENMLFRGIHKTIHNLDVPTREKYEKVFGVAEVANLFRLAELEWGKDIVNEPPVPEYLISPTEWKRLAKSIGFYITKYVRVSPALAHFVLCKV